MKRVTWLPGVLVLAGCAYYNGLYNANRLAHEAQRAEREGRIGEARSFWSQAAVKAESVASRHPKSKYRDDALLLQGRALAQMEACVQAVKPLALAADSSPDRRLRADARMLLGECRLQLRQPDSTLVVITPLLQEANATQRSAALLLRGRALLRLDRNDEALEDLTASGAPDAVFARAIALTRLGRRDEATTALAAAVDQPYSETGWLTALDTVGAGTPGSVTGLVDRLTARPGLGVGARLRLWLEDGERWLRVADTATAARRFEQVREAGPDSTEGRSARAYLGVVAAARATDWSAVAALLDSLNAAIRIGGPPVQIGGRHVSVLTRARKELDEDGTPLGLFLASEDIRDSLANPVLAASMMEQVAERYPESVLAPKALLALAVYRPAVADSLVALVRQRYPTSPYTLVLAGQGSEAFEALEDSLAAAARGGARHPPGEKAAPKRGEETRRRVRNDR